MPNIVNQAITTEYEQEFDGGLDALFVQPVGLSVEDVNAFRAKLDEAQLSMRVVKGTLARRLLESQGLTGLDPIFEGPAALIMGNEVDGQRVDGAAITAAKILEGWLKETGGELPRFKGGVLEGEVLDAEGAKALAKMPSKQDLQARIVSQIIGPAASISGQLIAGGGKIAGAIESHIKKLEEGEG